MNKDYYVVSSFDKKILLDHRNKNPRKDFKALTEKELFSNLSYYGNDASLIALYRLTHSFANASEINDNLFFLKSNVSQHIDELLSIREKLINEGCINVNQLYVEFLKRGNIYLPKYQKNNKELLKLLELHKLSYNFYEENNADSLSYYSFESREDEIRYLIEQIGELLKKGIPTNKIKVVCDSDYFLSLLKYNSLLPFTFFSNNFEKYYYSDDFQLFLKEYSGDVETTYKQVITDIKNSNLFNQLIAKYLKQKNYLNADEILPFLGFFAKKMSFPLDGDIACVSLDETNFDDYILIPDFRLEKYPSNSKDDDFLSDKEKTALGRLTSHENMILELEKIKHILLSLEHVYLSFSEKNYQEQYYVSPLIEILSIKKEKYQFKDIFFSKEHINYFLGKHFDDKKKFSYISPYVADLDEKDYKYRNYQHAFQKFSFSIDKIVLSYTSIDLFFHCAFHYYLSNILKIDDHEDTIFSVIGTIAHQMMEDLVKDEVKPFLSYLVNDLSPRDYFLISMLETPLVKAVEQQKLFFEKSPLKYHYAEKGSYSYQIDDKSLLIGKIDLICAGNNHYIITDYKTSDFVFDKNQLEFGLSLQLPLYYLLTQNSSFKSSELSGLYIKRILSRDYKKDDYDYLLLNGITLDDPAIIEGDESFIRRKGRKKEVAITEKEEFLSYIDIAKNKLNECVTLIEKGEFTINPKILKNKNISCEYCAFKDICYHDYGDNIYLTPEEEEDDEE